MICFAIPSDVKLHPLRTHQFYKINVPRMEHRRGSGKPGMPRGFTTVRVLNKYVASCPD